MAGLYYFGLLTIRNTNDTMISILNLSFAFIVEFHQES